MTSNPFQLPDDFVTNIRNVAGAEGEKFLTELPSLIDAAAARWGLRDIEAVPNLSYHFVASARQDGRDVILKMGVPNPELSSQIHALRLYDGNGACKLLEAEEDRGWMLLERLKPGRMLSELRDDEQATALAAAVMRELWRPAVDDGTLILLRDWFDNMTREWIRIEGAIPVRLKDKARSLAGELFADARPHVLLHGDFHHYNLLESERGWLIIDPKGVIGPPGYEVGPFLLNPFDLLERPDPLRVTERRIAILADVLGFEREYVKSWGIAHAVLSATWDLEGDGSPENSLRCAEMIEAAKI